MNDLGDLARIRAEEIYQTLMAEELTDKNLAEYNQKFKETLDKVREEVANLKIYKSIEYLRLAFDKRENNLLVVILPILFPTWISTSLICLQKRKDILVLN